MIIRYNTIVTLICLITFSAQINGASCFPFFCGTKKSKEKSKYYPTPSFKRRSPSASPTTLRARANQEIREINLCGGIVDQNTDLAGGRAVSCLRQLKQVCSKDEAVDSSFMIAQLRDMRAQYSPKRDAPMTPFSLPPAIKID
jgi:hypothetical protein